VLILKITTVVLVGVFTVHLSN